MFRNWLRNVPVNPTAHCALESVQLALSHQRTQRCVPRHWTIIQLNELTNARPFNITREYFACTHTHSQTHCRAHVHVRRSPVEEFAEKCVCAIKHARVRVWHGMSGRARTQVRQLATCDAPATVTVSARCQQFWPCRRRWRTR